MRERTRSLAYCDVAAAAAARRHVILRDFTRSRSKTVHSFDVFLFVLKVYKSFLRFLKCLFVKEFEARLTEDLVEETKTEKG